MTGQAVIVFPNQKSVWTGSTGALAQSLSVRELLKLSTLNDVGVLAGADGLGRAVKRLNMMTVPEILPWVKEGELLLTTGYPLPRSPRELTRLIVDLNACDLAALAIKLGNYVDHVPAQALDQADDLGFPILQIPHEIGFDDIVGQILTDITNRQAASLIRAEEVHRAFVQIVLDGGGMAEITGELARVIEAGAIVIDRDDRIVAETGFDDVKDALADAGLLDPDGGVLVEHLLRSGGVRAQGVHVASVPVAAGTLRYGHIMVVKPGSRLPEDTMIVLERAATVAALDVTKRLAVTAVERKYQSDFVHDLLTGRDNKPGDLSKRAEHLGWDLDRPLIVVVAEMDAEAVGDRSDSRLGQDTILERLASVWVSRVQSRDRGAAAAVLGREFMAIIGALDHAEAPVDVTQLISGVADEMAGIARRTFSFGVSRTVVPLRDLPEAYKQARQAARVGRQVHGSGLVTTFDSLGVLRLLSLIKDSGELHSFTQDTLGPVLRLKPRERDDLLHTLSVLIECNLNATVAAQELHFHYNTVRYRIAKLERLLGAFCADRNLCQRISIALQIIQLESISR